MTEEEIDKIIKNEELNDNYIPQRGHGVYRLPYVNSNKVDWEHGIVLEVWLDGSTKEALISTNTGHQLVEYLDYLIPTGLNYYPENGRI